MYTLLTTPSIFRSVRRIVEPAVEPVSVAEAKEHLRLLPEQADDDAYIGALISACRYAAEEFTSRTFTATRWQAKFSNWNTCTCRGVEMPYPPLLYDDEHSVMITYEEDDGSISYVNDEDLRVDPDELPGRVRLLRGISGYCCDGNATIKWWGGTVDPLGVPMPVKAAIMRMVAQLYGSRGDDPSVILREDLAVRQMLGSVSWNGRC